MGFNVGNFITNAGSSIADRIIGSAVNSVDSAAGNAGYVNLATSIISSGASISTVKSIASMSFDKFLDGIASNFFSQLKGSITAQVPGRNPLAATTDSLTSQICPIASELSALHYPNDLGEYKFKLQFAKYDRPVPLSQSKTKVTQTIYLPLPRELRSGHHLSLDTPETGLVGSVANALQLAIEKKASGLGEAAGGVAASAVIDGISGLSFIPGVENLVTVGEQSLGIVPNSNLSVAFKGPQLRKLTFSWEFSPNNEMESKRLQFILEEIQQRSLTRYTMAGSAAILSYPETCRPTVLPISDDGSPTRNKIGDLIKFKNALIESIDIDYGPNGIPSFFKGTKAPTFIGLTITLQEIEYFVSSDYGGPASGGFTPTANQVGNAVLSVGRTTAGVVLEGVDAAKGWFGK